MTVIRHLRKLPAITLATLSLFYTGASHASTPTENIGKCKAAIQSHFVNIKDVAPEELKVRFKSMRGAGALEKITFKIYIDDTRTLLKCHIRRGAVVRLIDRNGEDLVIESSDIGSGVVK